MNGNVIRTITIRGTSEGLDKVTADLNKLASAQENVAVVSEQSAKRVLSLEDAWKRQTMRLDEAARAQANIARETKIADQALKEGLATQAQHAQRLDQINQRYSTTAKTTAEFGKQTGLARHELINLGRQVQDIGVSLVSGQSPFMVIAQQVPQMADVFMASGKSVGDFFSQAVGWAGRFLLSTTGIITAIAAVGAAIGYMAYQFLKSSTTVEEALEKQKSLMDATKTSIGELIDAQIRLQSVETARFEGLRNQEDLQQKLIKSARDLALLSERRTSSPLQDIGAALGIGPAADPSGGYEKIAAAVERLKAAAASGTPDVVAFRNEVAGIGEAARTSDPGVATFAEKILKLSLEALNLETSLLKARAALQSVAQSNLNNLGAKEAAEATERLAVAATNILNTYPGITVETAKTLANLTSQMTTQEANNVKVQLEGQFRSINATYQEKINQLLQQGLILTSAVADAEQNRQAAIAAAVKSATDLNSVLAQRVDYQLTAYEQQQGMTSTYKEQSDYGKGSAKSAREQAQSAEEQAQSVEEQAKAREDAAEYAAEEAEAARQAAQHTEFGSEAAGRFARNAQEAADAMGRAAANAASAAFWAESMNEIIENRMDMMSTQFEPGAEYTYDIDPLNIRGQKAVLERQIAQTGEGRLVQKKHGLAESSFGTWEIEYDKPMAERIQDAAKKAFADNTAATKENTAATQTMTDVLSPFYSSDPRRTHLGFRAFAGGGIMTPYGELPLKHYQGGGVATSPQVAVYGEGRTPEAYVPVPSGRIPVEIRQPANSNQRPVNVTINIRGDADANTVAALKTTAFQQAQAMRRAMR